MQNGLHSGGLNTQPLSHEFLALPLDQGVLPMINFLDHRHLPDSNALIIHNILNNKFLPARNPRQKNSNNHLSIES
jgi:hypothetical protein